MLRQQTPENAQHFKNCLRTTAMRQNIKEESRGTAVISFTLISVNQTIHQIGDSIAIRPKIKKLL